LKKTILYATLPLGDFIITIIFYPGGGKMKQSSLQYRHQSETATLIIKLKIFALVLYALVFMAIIFCFVTLFYCGYETILTISNPIITVIIAIFLYLTISKISILEEIEDDLIERGREVIHGWRKCKKCPAYHNILWPQRGGICDKCLVENYTLEEAKEGLCGCHHISAEETYREFTRNQKLP